MQCPIDGTTLVITDRSGVEIDYCPKCRGVWLDRGELDKIIARSAEFTPPPPPKEDRGFRDGDAGQYQKKKKRGGFADILDDIFDF